MGHLLEHAMLLTRPVNWERLPTIGAERRSDVVLIPLLAVHPRRLRGRCCRAVAR